MESTNHLRGSGRASSSSNNNNNSNNNDPRKKFTIKPFRSHVPMDESSARSVWSHLDRAINEIHNRNASQLSFEELYRNAYNLVLHKHGALLYDGVAHKMARHLADDVVPPLASSVETGLLAGVSEAWEDHQVTMIMVRDILMYMDRTYVHQQKLRPVYDLGLALFREIVWEHPAVQPRCTALLLDIIRQEREGQIIDVSLVKVVLGMLLELGGRGTGVQVHRHHSAAYNHPGSAAAAADFHGGNNVYERDFEHVFLGTTQEFYHLESLEYLSKNTASDYVTRAQTRLAEETDRAKRYLSPSTEVPLLSIVETEWIERHARTLVDMDHSGYAALLQHAETKMEDLVKMYDLFARVPSTVEHLREALSKAVRGDGRALVAAQERGASEPTSFVRGVLKMRTKYAAVVDVAFRREKRAQKKLKEAFEHFLNQDSRAASCLAVYVDELLRGGLRGCDESRTDAELRNVILVFRYLQDKDVFESFYKQHLAKRLLSGRSVGEEAERAMVSQLKAECGYQFTSKMEGMFNDMRISRDTRDAYRRYEKGRAAGGAAGGGAAAKGKKKKAATVSAEGKEDGTTTSGDTPMDTSPSDSDSDTDPNLPFVEIEVDVLTTGYWPSQSVPMCTLPREVQRAMKRFQTFYLQKHTGRKLSWQTSTGSADLRATFGSLDTTTNNDGAATNTSNNKRNTKRRVHDLCVTTYQMCILVLFNESTTWSLQDIASRTSIPDAELRRHLISLCTPKHRILRKASRGKVITEDDSFTYNADFTSKLKRVKVPLVSMKETIAADGDRGGGSGGAAGASTAAGTKDGRMLSSSLGTSSSTGNPSSSASGTMAVPASVEEDRRHLVEAVVMRVMKARKTLHHNDLIAEVTKQLSVRFVPAPAFVKKRIESLIERDYLERSEEDRRVYVYLA